MIILKRSEKLGLVLDVETTGLGPTKDEVIELALKLFSYRTDTGEVIEIIHGIPYELVEGKSFYDAKIKTYFHRADSVFAHNASFDRSFLFHMYPEVNDLKWYCTMRNIPWKNYGFPNGKLLTLLQAHNITNYQTHRALDDITYLLELLKKTSPNGNLYLQEVLEKSPMRKYQPAASRSRMG
jgi:DNA polymerase-3 subunit epsilon